MQLLILSLDGWIPITVPAGCYSTKGSCALLLHQTSLEQYPGYPPHPWLSHKHWVQSQHTHKKIVASESARAAVNGHIRGYPENINASLNQGQCFLPAGIAAVLKTTPDGWLPESRHFTSRTPLTCRPVVFARHSRLKYKKWRRSLSLNVCMYSWCNKSLCQTSGVDTSCLLCLIPSPEPMNWAWSGLVDLRSYAPNVAHFSDSKKCFVTASPFWAGFLKSLKKNDHFKGLTEGSA